MQPPETNKCPDVTDRLHSLRTRINQAVCGDTASPRAGWQVRVALISNLVDEGETAKPSFVLKRRHLNPHLGEIDQHIL